MIFTAPNATKVAVPGDRTLSIRSEGEAIVTILTGQHSGGWSRTVGPDRPFSFGADGLPFRAEIRAITGDADYTLLYRYRAVRSRRAVHGQWHFASRGQRLLASLRR